MLKKHVLFSKRNVSFFFLIKTNPGLNFNNIGRSYELKKKNGFANDSFQYIREGCLILNRIVYIAIKISVQHFTIYRYLIRCRSHTIRFDVFLLKYRMDVSHQTMAIFCLYFLYVDQITEAT